MRGSMQQSDYSTKTIISKNVTRKEVIIST